jgi:hypothetical protein
MKKAIKKDTKKDGSLVKEYIQKISTEDLSFIVERLDQPLCGDRSDVALVFQKDKELDRWLMQSSGSEDWFNRVDFIQEAAIIEMSKRQLIKS